MPDSVKIPFEGDSSDLVAEAQKVQHEMDAIAAKLKAAGVSQNAYNKVVADHKKVADANSKAINDNKKALTDHSAAINKNKISLTDLRSAYQMVIDVVRLAVQAYSAVIDKHLEYANQVRSLSTISGQSAEETSRFIQVLDDYKISAEDATIATKALTKEGHAPSIQTLADLSDKYKALTTVEEKNEFVLKNLGKGGLQWVEVLNKGSKAILAQGDAVSENLILNQKQLDDARRLEIAWDGFGDSVTGLKENIAKDLTPTLVEMAKSWDWATQIAVEFYDAVKNGTVDEFNLAKVQHDVKVGIEENEKAMLASADAADANAEGLDGLADSSISAKDAAQELSRELTGLLSAMFAIDSQTDGYQKTLTDLINKEGDLENEKNRLVIKMNEEQRAGKLTNDEYMEYVKNLGEIEQKQKDNTQAIADAGEENQKAGEKRMYDLVQQKMAADGVITSGEYEYLQNLAVQKGLVSRASADQAIAENQAADAMVASFQKTQGPMDAALNSMREMASYNGMVVNFGVNFTQTGEATTPGAYQYSGGTTKKTTGLNVTGSAGKSKNSLTGSSFVNGITGTGGMSKKDSGGRGTAGSAYFIGSGAQPEAFIPDTNGTFIPNANKGLGSTYNITILNPKKEAAEDSIRSTMKKLSYTGAVQ